MSESVKLIRIGEPNFELLSKYCRLIKGYGTATELAEKIGVNASTISRILNGKLTSPITEDTITKLAELIPQELGITKAQLYRANGMANPNDVSVSVRLQSRREQEKKMSDIISNEIMRRDNSVWKYANQVRLSFGDFYYAFPNFVIETDAVKDEDKPENHNWAFEFITDPIDSGIKSDKFYEADMARRVMQKLGSYIALYYQCDEDYSSDYEYHNFPLKLSFGFASLKMYESAVSRFKDMKLPMEVSLLYIDMEGRRVAKEMPLRALNGYRYSIYFDNSYTFFDDDDNEISEAEWIEGIEAEVEQYMQTKDKGEKE